MDPLHKTDSAISVTYKANCDDQDARRDGPHPPAQAPLHAHASSDNRPSQSSVSPDDEDSELAAAGTRLEKSPSPVLPPQVRASAMKEELVRPPDSAQATSAARREHQEHESRSRPVTPPASVVKPPRDEQPTPGPHAPSPSDEPTADGAPEEEQGHDQDSSDELDALTQSGRGAIVVDQDELDLESDPGYGSDRGSLASTSLSSSVQDYLFENGRRYHRFREGRYNFPNDEAEQDREDLKHACVKMLCQQQLYFAPLEQGRLHNILDIGTGTGIWAIEMGDQFPSANVVGIDLSPIQPDWVPSNVHFVVDDAESEWVYPENHFDYIHTRHTVMAIKDWPRLYRTAKEWVYQLARQLGDHAADKESYSHLRPGGWIESQEIYHYPISANDSMSPDHPVAQYWALIHQGLNTLGVDFQAAAGGKIAAMMRDAGFENVHERIFHVPLGTWPKHPDLKIVGEYWRHVLLTGAQAIALGPLTRGCGWTREQVEVFLIELRKAYFDNSCLMYMPMYVTCGQKPEY